MRVLQSQDLDDRVGKVIQRVSLSARGIRSLTVQLTWGFIILEGSKRLQCKISPSKNQGLQDQNILRLQRASQLNIGDEGLDELITLKLFFDIPQIIMPSVLRGCSRGG